MSLPSTDALSTGNFFSACTAALTKKLMKPSLTPCSFSKRSWKRLRISITGAMLTSLKVVRMALLDCDCSKRSATRARRRVMGTRCSGRWPKSGAAGALTCGKVLVGTPVGMDAAWTAARGAGAASTSPLVTRPSLPVPTTEPAAMPLSAISLAAAGMATPAMEPALATGTGALEAAAAGAAAAGAAAVPTPAESMRAISCSATTVPPSATSISVSMPADGAGTSSTTLSVSISIRISSAATMSPAFFFHCSMVASATDSESWGTLTSTIAMVFLSVCRGISGYVGADGQRAYLVSTKPLILENAPSTSAFCCSWCRCE